MGLINVADAFSEYIRKVCTDALNNYAIQDGLRDEKVTPTIEPETEEEAYERGYTAGQMAYRKTGRWIKKRYWSEGVGMGESYGYWYACSECNHEVKRGYGGCSDRFCLNCGAAMTEEGEQDA